VLVAYPFVGFQEGLIGADTAVDIYVHLLGYCLAFIVVYAFVFVIDEHGETDDGPSPLRGWT